MLLADNKRLQQRLKAMQETINSVTDKNVELLSEKETFGWTSACKKWKKYLIHLKRKFHKTVSLFSFFLIHYTSNVNTIGHFDLIETKICQTKLRNFLLQNSSEFAI